MRASEVRGGSLFNGIYSDPRQEYKRPMAIIRCWISEAGGLSSVTLSPGPSGQEDFRITLQWVLLEMVCLGSGRVEKGGGLRPGGGMEPRPGEQMQGQHKGAGSCGGGGSGQEEELPPDGPSSLQGHHASHQ